MSARMRKVPPPPAHKKTARQGANKRHRLHRKRAVRRAKVQGWSKTLAKRALWVVLILALIAAGGVGAWRGMQAYRDGRILTVNRIEVTGNHQWEASRLLEAAKLEVGARLPDISLRKVRQALVQLPGIQQVTVHRSLTGDLQVEVREDEVLALRRGAGWLGLTASGNWIPLRILVSDVPVIAGGIASDTGASIALAGFLATTRERYPDLFAAFSQIALRSPEDADIYWRNGRMKVRVDYANKSLNSLEFLRALLRGEAATWKSGSTVDLSVEGYAYVR